eukprot:TRINITY_DN79_c2_g6_i3.p1 TRINITY_DN79_c2_g6~~TRINITY_DN79_c2_g6_i3.p1  ORF type:complete len:1762 (+),score=484.67 TRINITY_DN79_c2_g6_i3:636-5288(+)
MEQIKQEKQWKFNGAISSLLMMESIDGSRIEFENTQTRISLEPCQILPSFKTSFPFFSDISSFINRLFENEKYSVENSQNQFDSISDNSSLLRARFSLKLPWLIGESYDLDDLTLKSNIHHYVNNLVCGSLSAIGVRKSVGFSFSVTVSSICKSIEPQGISLPTVYAVWWGLYKSFALAGTAISFSSDSLKGSNDEEISEILESLRIDPSSNITAQLLSVVWKIWLEHTNCQRKGSISSVLNRSLLAQPSVLSLWHQIPPCSKMDETLQLNWLCWCLLISTATNPIKSDAEAIWPTINNFKKQILSQTQKDISRLETLWENLPYVLSSMQGIIPSFISVVSSGVPQSYQSSMDTYLAKCCVELLINYSTISPLSKIKKVSESECSCLASCLMSLYEKNQRTSPIIPQLISQAIHSSGGPNGAIGILFMHIISLRLSESKKSNDADYLCEKVNSFINLLEHYTTSQTSNEKLITSEGDLFEVLLASHASSLFRIAVKILNEPKSKDVSRLNQKSISGIRKSIEQIMKRKPTASEYRILFLRLLTQDGTLEKSDIFLFPEQTTILTKEFVEEIKEFKDYSEKPTGDLLPVNFLMVLGLPATINLLNNGFNLERDDNSDLNKKRVDLALSKWRERVKDALKGSTVRNIQFYEQYLILLAIAYNVVSKKETNKETLNIIFKEISPSSQRERNIVVEVGTFLSQLSSSHIPDCLKKFLISGDEKCQSFLHFLCHLAVFGTKLSKLSGMQSELSVFGRILEEPQNGCNMFLPSCPFSSVEKAVQHEPEANWVYTCPNKHPFITGQCEHINNSIVKCEICGEQIGAVKYGSATTGTTFLGHTLTIATQIASGAHPYLLTKGFDDTSLLGVGRKDYTVSSFSGLTLSALAMQRLLLSSSILLSATINPLASVAQVSRSPILSIEGFFSDMLRTLETGHCEALRKLGIPNNVDCFRIIHAIVNKADERLFSHSQENNLLTDLANYQVSSIFEKEFHKIFTDPILSQWGTISMQMNANNQSSANVKCISDLREQLTKRSIAIKEVELRFDKSPSCLSKLIFLSFEPTISTQQLLQKALNSPELSLEMKPASNLLEMNESNDLKKIGHLKNIIPFANAVKSQCKLGREEAKITSIAKFIKEIPDKQISDQLLRKIKPFCDSWNSVWKTLITSTPPYQYHCHIFTEKEMINMNNDVSVAELLPSDQDEGYRFKALLHHLFDTYSIASSTCNSVLQGAPISEVKSVFELRESDLISIDPLTHVLPHLLPHLKFALKCNERNEIHSDFISSPSATTTTSTTITTSSTSTSSSLHSSSFTNFSLKVMNSAGVLGKPLVKLQQVATAGNEAAPAIAVESAAYATAARMDDISALESVVPQQLMGKEAMNFIRIVNKKHYGHLTRFLMQVQLLLINIKPKGIQKLSFCELNVAELFGPKECEIRDYMQKQKDNTHFMLFHIVHALDELWEPSMPLVHLPDGAREHFTTFIESISPARCNTLRIALRRLGRTIFSEDNMDTSKRLNDYLECLESVTVDDATLAALDRFNVEHTTALLRLLESQNLGFK